MIRKIIKLVKHPVKIIIYFASKGIINYDDKKYIEYVYKEKTGKKANLENPQTFNEKIQYLKLYNRNPLYTTLVDKMLAKEYVSKKLSKNYIIPTIKVYDSVKKINFSELPNQFVLKTTHDSGTSIICKDKKTFNEREAIKLLKKRLKRKYFYLWREWPYKNVKPRIIAEKYLEDSKGEMTDYKFYCFDGKAEYVMICTDRGSNVKFYYYDRQWQLQKNMSSDGKKTNKNFKLDKPQNLEKMFQVAEQLSKGMKFVRIDLYNVDGKIYFGEYTFYPSAGFDITRTEECETILSSKLLIEKEQQNEKNWIYN